VGETAQVAVTSREDELAVVLMNMLTCVRQLLVGGAAGVGWAWVNTLTCGAPAAGGCGGVRGRWRCSTV